ncbi:MAG: phage terminase large subunit, partial [Candidatus Heimdallarchaeaceae archaeon]
MAKTELRFQDGPQKAFSKNDADVCVYGGAAGGGKTFATLLLIYIHAHNDPLYRAVVFRRTMPMILNPGSLWDTAKRLWLPIDSRIRFMERDKEIRFPNGAIIKFAQMEKTSAYLDWQGAELTGVFFEEATHFEEEQVEYLFSRMRSDSKRDSYMKMTCNPDASSFLRTWLVEGGFVHDETGFAIPEMSGKKKYFVRREGKMVWGNSPEELAEFLNDPEIVEDNEALSFTFICSKLSDNPLMVENNPRYKASLKGLSPAKRQALLEGNWNYVQGAKELFD